MDKNNFSLTTKETVAVLMVINEKIINDENMRSAWVQRSEDKRRVERLDAEIKKLTEAYQAIQDALEEPDHGQEI